MIFPDFTKKLEPDSDGDNSDDGLEALLHVTDIVSGALGRATRLNENTPRVEFLLNGTSAFSPYDHFRKISKLIPGPQDCLHAPTRHNSHLLAIFFEEPEDSSAWVGKLGSSTDPYASWFASTVATGEPGEFDIFELFKPEALYIEGFSALDWPATILADAWQMLMKGGVDPGMIGKMRACAPMFTPSPLFDA